MVFTQPKPKKDKPRPAVGPNEPVPGIRVKDQMAQVSANADDYAAARVGIFFPAHNQTPADGNLTGQCVTLNKWFLAEMTDVPNAFSARGDARYVGDTLVKQGYAVEVPYANRKRGDFVVYKYGTYGHIGVLLSGDRIFEENVNAGGAKRRLVDGAYVYAARIGSLGESWRPVRPNIYRIKSYSERGSGQMIVQDADNWYNRLNKTHQLIYGRDLSRANFKGFVGKDFLTFVEFISDSPEADTVQHWQTVGKTAVNDKWDKQIYALQDKVKALSTRPTAEELKAAKDQAADLAKQVTDANERAKAAEEKSAALEVEHIKAQETGNAFTRWLGEQLNKILGKGQGETPG